MRLEWLAVDVSGNPELEEAWVYAERSDEDIEVYGYVLRLKDGSKTSPYRAYTDHYLSSHTFLYRAQKAVEKDVGAEGEHARVKFPNVEWGIIYILHAEKHMKHVQSAHERVARPAIRQPITVTSTWRLPDIDEDI